MCAEIVIPRSVSTWGVVTVLGNVAGRGTETKSNICNICVYYISHYITEMISDRCPSELLMNTGYLMGWAMNQPDVAVLLLLS